MRALLINPPSPFDVLPGLREERHERHLPPLGMAYVAAALRADGHRVEMVDGAVPGPETSASRVDDILERVWTGDYDAVGLYLTMLGLHWGVHLTRAIRRARPKTWILAGGPQITVNPELFLVQHPEVDVVVRGEGENTVRELFRLREEGLATHQVAGIGYRTTEGVRLTETRRLIDDLDSLPWPARDLLPLLPTYARIHDPATGRKSIATSLITSRGCPFRCTFCSMPAYARANRGKRWRARSPVCVAAEAKHVVEQFGVDRILFCDDHFLLDVERARYLAEEWQAQDVRAAFSFSARVTQVLQAEPILPELRRAGCVSIEIGVESGSQRILDLLHKGTTVEQNMRAIRLLLKHDIVPVVNTIMFVPETTLDDLERNLSFFEEINTLCYFPFHWQNKLVPLPGAQATADLGFDERKIDWAAGPPDYEFLDPIVGKLYRAIQHFEEETGWYNWLGRCEDLAGMDEEQTSTTWRAGLRLAQTVLRRLPLHVFRRLLTMARSDRLDKDLPGLISDVETRLETVKSRIQGLEAAAPGKA